jgi:hypothetical protein
MSHLFDHSGPSIIYCTAKNCRHASTHNILSHLCNRCGEYGHGIEVCEHINDVTILCDRSSKGIVDNKSSKSVVDNRPSKIFLECRIIPSELHCVAINCQHNTTHTIDGHKCRICKRYGHGLYQCIHESPEKIAGAFEKRNNTYICTYSGMGHFSYHRRNTPDSSFQSLRIGPYSDEGDYLQLDSFLKNYQPLRTIDKFSYTSQKRTTIG